MTYRNKSNPKPKSRVVQTSTMSNFVDMSFEGCSIELEKILNKVSNEDAYGGNQNSSEMKCIDSQSNYRNLLPISANQNTTRNVTSAIANQAELMPK